MAVDMIPASGWSEKVQGCESIVSWNESAGLGNACEDVQIMPADNVRNFVHITALHRLQLKVVPEVIEFLLDSWLMAA